MSTELKEQIARAIRIAWHGGDENDVAEAVMAVLREQEPVARARWVENGCALEIVGLTNSGEFIALSAAKRKPPRFDLFAAPVPPAASAAPEGFVLVRSPITEEMHVAAVKVLHRAAGVDGLPQRMLDAMLAVAPKSEGESCP